MMTRDVADKPPANPPSIPLSNPHCHSNPHPPPHTHTHLLYLSLHPFPFSLFLSVTAIHFLSPDKATHKDGDGDKNNGA